MHNGTRQRVLRERARGTVLELRPGLALDELVATGQRFDTIVSIGFLAGASEPRRAVDAIVRLLVDDGQLLLLEPTSTPGVAGTLRRLAGGTRHDVPTMLRAAGLSMSECERIHSPTGVWVEAVAFHTIFAAREVIVP